MIEEIKTDNNCIIKAFENNPISILHEDINNKKVYYFKASDVGKVLGIVNIHSTIQNYEEDDERVIRKAYDTEKRIQDTTFLTSQGVYRLLYSSKKEIAKKFRKWAGNILDDIIFNESEELKRQLEENKKILAEKDIIIKQLENKPETEGFTLTEGFIYLIKDNCKLGHYKIGLSEDPNKRIVGLNVSSSTNSLEIVNTYKTKNTIIAEKIIHSILFTHKIKKQKEWFYVTNEILLDFIIKIIKDCIEFSDKYTFGSIDEEIVFLQKNIVKNKKEYYVKLTNKEIQTDIEAINTVNFDSSDNDEYIFKKFLEESCIFDDLAYCSKRDLIYQYKTWSKINNIFNYKKFEQYILNTFKSKKMLNENFNVDMCCILGLKLKPQFYNFNFENITIYENFLIEKCIKIPTGKLNRSTIKDSFEKWLITKEEPTSKKYTINSLCKLLDNYFLKDFFQDGKSSYHGWYGVTLKENALKGTGITSTMCKKNIVYKIYKNNPAEIIKQWDCQKKVSEEFGIAKTTVAYRINNKVILKDHNNKEFVLIRAKDFEKK